jgi:hypothetical protein
MSLPASGQRDAGHLGGIGQSTGAPPQPGLYGNTGGHGQPTNVSFGSFGDHHG